MTSFDNDFNVHVRVVMHHLNIELGWAKERAKTTKRKTNKIENKTNNNNKANSIKFSRLGKQHRSQNNINVDHYTLELELNYIVVHVK